MIFRNDNHGVTFEKEIKYHKGCSRKFAAALFLLTADTRLWHLAENHIGTNEIDIAAIKPRRLDGMSYVCYGRQFIADTWTETAPATLYGIEKYLGSGLIKGVGPRLAKRIVSQFGLDTIEVIENTPDRLIEIPKIGKKRVEKIKVSWERQKEVKNVMLFLQGCGVTTGFAAKIYKVYGSESISKVKANPYCLADDIRGIGFKTADKIAESLGFDRESYVRCRSGLMYTLNELADEGHTFAQKEQLLKKGVGLLEASELAAPSGSGKTYLLTYLLAQLAKQPGRVLLADFKGIDFIEIDGCSNYFRHEAVGEALNITFATLQERMRNPQPDNLPLFFVVDEWSGFLSLYSKKEQDELKQKMASILILGRGAGVFVVMALQRADANYITGRDNFGNALGPGRLSAEATRMLFPDDSANIQAKGRGHGYLRTDGKPLREIIVPQIRDISQAKRKVRNNLNSCY